MLTNMPALGEALVLSAVGMSVVFVFLSCLVGLLSLLQFFQDDELPSNSNTPKPQNSIVQNRQQAAAIAVAVHESERSQ